MIQLLWELLWPAALYELLTECFRVILPGWESLAVQTVSAFTVSGILTVLYRRSASSPKKNTEEKSVKTLSTGIVSAGVLLAAAGVSSSLFFNNLITLSGIKNVFTGYRQTAQGLYSLPLGFQLIATGVVISGAEELIFRGFIYGSLRKRYSFRTAAVIASVLFGWYHGNLVQGLYACGFSMVLVYSYEKYGSILAPWIIHGTGNLTSILAGKWAKFEEKGTGISFLFITVFSGLCLLFAVKKMKAAGDNFKKEVIQ